MKILTFSPYIYVDGKQYSKNVTGFGYMAAFTAESLSALGHEVGVYTHSYFTSEKKTDSFFFVSHSKRDIIRAFFNINNIKRCYKYSRVARKNPNKLKKRLKTIYYFISIGHLEKTIKKHKPDIAHIQSIGEGTIPFMVSCINQGIPFVITLHGLVLKMGASYHHINLEKLLIESATNKSISISTVSEGVKRDAVNIYDTDGSTITSVANGNRVLVPKYDARKLKERLGIPNEDKVILCVGTLGERKNQRMVIQFVKMAKERGIDNITAVFVGADSTNGELQNYTSDIGILEKVKFMGVIPHMDLGDYYNISDITILLSYGEGFPGSLIESALFGKPIVCFSDLSGSEEFDDTNSVKIQVHNLEDVYAGVIKALNNNWDYELIKERAKIFSLENMAKNYIELFERVIEQRCELTEGELYIIWKDSFENS